MKIAIASGKGGTGKTTLATNFAAYMAEDRGVILADLDVEEPNSGLFIRGKKLSHELKYKMVPSWVEKDCTFCGLCDEVCNYNAILNLGNQIIIYPDICHSCYACSELCPTGALPMGKRRMGRISHYRKGNLDFVEGKLDVGQEQAVPLISQTISFAESLNSDDKLIILDSPPGTSCPVIEAVKDTHKVVLVTEPTPFGLHDLNLAVEIMEKLNRDYSVVINRFGTGDKGVEEYCERRGIRVVAKLDDDREIAELYSEGELIYKKIPGFRRSLDKIKDYIRE